MKESREKKSKDTLQADGTMLNAMMMTDKFF